ncbi:hypothetical protein ABZ434_03275 [Streptomyces sp. NPDC005761]|uniref:hypothetical protein n=1 Tax=unclassified Streptomyces TaxID=2593676 RepID=UPI0033E50E0B
MKRQTPRSATALNAAGATCAVIGVLLWLRSRTGAGPTLTLYRSTDFEGSKPSAWRLWSPLLPEERLGMYLLAAALVLALAARLVATWRE